MDHDFYIISSDEEILPLSERLKNNAKKNTEASEEIKIDPEISCVKPPSISTIIKASKRKASLLTPITPLDRKIKRFSCKPTPDFSVNCSTSVFDSSHDLFSSSIQDDPIQTRDDLNISYNNSPSTSLNGSFLGLSNSRFFSDSELNVRTEISENQQVATFDLDEETDVQRFEGNKKYSLAARFSLISNFDDLLSPEVKTSETQFSIQNIPPVTINLDSDTEDEINYGLSKVRKVERERTKKVQIKVHAMSESDESTEDLTQPFCKKTFFQNYDKKNLDKTLTKKQQMEVDKIKKKAAKELIKVRNDQLKGDLKFMHLIISENFQNMSDVDDLTSILKFNNLKYEFANYLPTATSIRWQRDLLSNLDDPLAPIASKVDEPHILICIQLSFLSSLIIQYKQDPLSPESFNQLKKFHSDNQILNPDTKIWYIAIGLKNFFKKHNKKLANQKKKDNHFDDSKIISEIDIEEGLLILCNDVEISLNTMETLIELSQFLVHTTKSVAQSQYKKQKRNNFAWAASSESSVPVKIDKDGKGGFKLWKKQLQQFNNTSKETTDAIAKLFPSPQMLLQAYSLCSNEKEAVNLLKNVTVTRGIGSSKTTRSVGPKLAHKIYKFLTSTNADLVLS